MKKITAFSFIFSLAVPLHGFATEIFSDTSFEDLLATIQKNHPHHVSEVLPLLPRSFLTSFTLVYNSQSIQGSTEQDPRAIVFGRTGKFVMAFNGNSAEQNFDTLEMMQFRDDTKSYELRRISFRDGKPVVSEKNPPVCLACHGQSPHPIWHSYPKWPGVYGSDDDTIGSKSTEGENFQKFMRGQDSHPVYKFLGQRTDLSAIWPYTESLSHVTRPNDRLGRLLSAHAAQSSARTVMNSSFYTAHPASVLFHLLRCDVASSPGHYQKIDTLFQARFPPSQFPALYEAVNSLKDPHDQATLKIEKLILDSERESWNLVPGFRPKENRFSPDDFSPANANGIAGAQIDDMIVNWMLASIAPADGELRPFYERWTATQQIDFRNAAGYTHAFIEPYGVAAAYEEVNSYLDWKKLHNACPILAARAAKELIL